MRQVFRSFRQRAAEAEGAPGAIPPAVAGLCEKAQATARHVSGRGFVAVPLEAAHAESVDRIREQLRMPGPELRAVLRRTGRGISTAGMPGLATLMR